MSDQAPAEGTATKGELLDALFAELAPINAEVNALMFDADNKLRMDTTPEEDARIDQLADQSTAITRRITAITTDTTPKEDPMTDTELNQYGDIVPTFHYSPDPSTIYANGIPVLDLFDLTAADDGYPERIITMAKDFVIDEHRGMDGKPLSYTAVNDVFHPMHLQARTLKELLVRIVYTAYGLAAHEEFIFDLDEVK